MACSNRANAAISCYFLHGVYCNGLNLMEYVVSACPRPSKADKLRGQDY